MAISVRMQPFEEEGHVASEFCIRRFRFRTQDTITVGVWIEQHLLDKEGSGFLHDATRSIHRLDCSSYRFFISGGDMEQNEHVIGQRSRPHGAHPRGEVQEVNGKS